MNRGDIKGLLYGLFIGGLLLGPACVWADGVGAMRREAGKSGTNLSDVNQNIDLRSDHSVNWSNSTANTDTLDVGIQRGAAGVLAVSDGTGSAGGGLRVGTGTDAVATGDFSAGTAGAARVFWDQSGPLLTVYNAAGAALLEYQPDATNTFSLHDSAGTGIALQLGTDGTGGYANIGGTFTGLTSDGDFAAGATATTQRIAWDSSASVFDWYDASNVVVLRHDASTPELELGSASAISFSATTDATAAKDVALVRKSASVLELTEGGAAGTARGNLYVDEFRIGTSDGDSNDVRMQTAGAGVLLVSNAAANAGTVRTYTKFDLNGSHIEGTTAGWSVKDTGVFSFSSTTAAFGTKDLGLARQAASVGRITDGSTGIGSLLHSLLVEANTDVAASPNAITAAESGSVFTNEGATAENHHDLPTAAAGLTYTFVVQDADGIQVNAAAGDTIRVVGTVSAAAGLIETTTIGNTVTLVAINATEWVATAVNGVWTVT